MTCQHCVSAITEAVAHVPGVTAVHVSLEDALASVTGENVVGDDVITAIIETGYDAEPA